MNCKLGGDPLRGAPRGLEALADGMVEKPRAGRLAVQAELAGWRLMPRIRVEPALGVVAIEVRPIGNENAARGLPPTPE